jgi:hypothetical protein
VKKDVALRLLGEIMGWDNNRAATEFAWLRLMSRLKYDSYRGFVAGVRFIESLAGWLQQFESGDRETVYRFVRERLLYIDPTAIQHLVELAYPEHVRGHLVTSAAAELGIPPYRVWASVDGHNRFASLLQRTLFLGLSDGARIDQFRRSNVGIITNEQVAVGIELDNNKWNSLLEKLRTKTGDDDARFRCVYLIDDFMGSGTTFLRHKDGEWDGKLVKFWNRIRDLRDSHLAPGFVVRVHHYIASFQARQYTEVNAKAISDERGDEWFADVQFSFGMVLSDEVRITGEDDPELAAILDRYYDEAIQTKHTDVGGHSKIHLGYGRCGLPLVLEHNTPNNSVALLWAESEGAISDDGSSRHAMRPLFRRQERHT